MLRRVETTERLWTLPGLHRHSAEAFAPDVRHSHDLCLSLVSATPRLLGPLEDKVFSEKDLHACQLGKANLVWQFRLTPIRPGTRMTSFL
eukprot:9427492-Alexandrium_andersonii.AAC.1